MNRTMTAAAICLLLTSAAFAQDTDADTRFHRAYEQEVVDGKIADAARVYLAMMGDEKVPERLRQEAKFRFAVTAVLLGRSDEARAYLAELVRDPKTPETLRARANEYLDVAKGIGVGSELDKKLQALVFDLGRVVPGDSSNPTPPVYRDFEIIGRPAIPLLRQLLQHSDKSLRQHAYILLMRMNEPGMGELWTPELGINWGAVRELAVYLKANAAEGAALEPRVLSAEDGQLDWFLAHSVPVSAEFLRAAAARNVTPSGLVQHALMSDGAAFEQLLLEWMKSDTPALASAAALGVATAAKKRPEQWRPDPAVFAAVAARLVATETSWTPTAYRRGDVGTGADSYKGFLRLASAADIGTLLDTMDAAIMRIGESTDDLSAGRAGVVADAVADAVEAKDPKGADAARYAELLRRWAMRPRARARQDFGRTMLDHVRFALRALPSADAEKLAVWAVTDKLNSASAVSLAIPNDRAEDIPVLLAAFRAADQPTRSDIVSAMGLNNGQSPKSPTPAYAHAVLAALPELAKWAADVRAAQPFGTFPRLALLVPADEARERLVAVVAAGAANPIAETRDGGLGVIFATSRAGDGVDVARYHAQIVVPSLEAILGAVAAADRPRVLLQAFSLIETSGPDPIVQQAVVDFILAHVEELPQDAGPMLAGRPAQFPLVAWVPHIKFAVFAHRMAVPVEAADEAVRRMTQDPSAVNGNTMVFTAEFASRQLKQDTFDRLLRTASLDRLPVVLYGTINATCDPASPEALEDALGRAVAADKPDLAVIAKLTLAVRMTRPSEKLAAAVPLLLKGTQAQILEGIDTAWSIGRMDMVPLLQTQLDSMDAAVRKKAREAIDSIRETQKLKDGAPK